MDCDKLLEWLENRNFKLYHDDNFRYRIDWYTPKGNELHSINQSLKTLLLQSYQFEKEQIKLGK